MVFLGLISVPTLKNILLFLNIKISTLKCNKMN
jgi:hypothetical protein